MNINIIKKEIKVRGLKQKELAKEIGVHPAAISRFLSGKSILNGEAMIALHRILNIK